MTRSERLHLPGFPVHITSRGVGGRAIFLSDAARQRFLRELLALREALPFLIHAYCLMTNHLHLLLEALEVPLSDILERLLGGHAARMNQSIGRVGHVFQGRFDDTVCRTEAHFRNAAAYIHNNPVRAGMVSSADQYSWSSHLELIGKASNLFIDRDRVLDAFGGLESYLERMSAPPGDDELSITNKTIGYRNFDEDFFRDLQGSDIKNSLERLACRAAETTGLRLEDITGPARARRESIARKLFIAQAEGLGVPGYLIARFLGRSVSAISKANKSTEGLAPN